MTITLAWWWLPVALIVAAIIVPFFFQTKSDWDFVTPIFGLGIALILIFAAIGICVGRWTA